MRIKTYTLSAIVSLAALCLLSCSDEPSDGSKIEAGKYSLSGKVEKGPFVRGSSISIQPLNESLHTIGTVFNGEIQDNTGSFNLGQIELASQFVRIASDGYYFNELTGNLSLGTLHLIALADLSNKSTVNVNILTHLKSARIQKLVEAGKTFAEANKQAQKELLTQFGLQTYENLLAESVSITSGNDGAGVLIAVSSQVLYNRSDAEITQYLSVLSQDLADDGSFTEENRQKIADDCEYIRDNIENIASNIVNRYEDLGMNITVPDLRYFFDWDGDGIAGNEFNLNPRITLSQSEVNFGKDGGEATITIDANFKYDVVPFGPQAPQDYQRVPFLYSNEPLVVETNLEGNTLTIKGGVNKANLKRSHTVNVYNVFDEIMATVTVNFEANPEYGLTLSSDAEKAMADVMRYLTSAHRRYSTFMHEYCVAESHKSDPSEPALNEMYDNYFSVVGRINNISRILSETGFPDYAKLIQTYNAIVYAEMMEIWGDIPLVKFTDDPMEYHQRTNTGEIRNHFISILKEALPYASDGMAPRSAGANLANKLFFLPKDMLYLALGDLCLHDGKYNEAYSSYETGIKHYTMSNSINYDRSNPELIFSPDEISVGGGGNSRSVHLSVATWPLYFLSDIRLRMAECQLKLNKVSEAQAIINDVVSYHPEFNYVSGSELEQIDAIHRDWHHPAYFAFLKRSGFAISKYGFENYQLLCPIPAAQLALDTSLTQNPGY